MTLEEKSQAYAQSVFSEAAKTYGEKLWNVFRDGGAAAYLTEAAEALATQWVSVRDRLPEDRQQIIYRYRWRNPKTGIWHDSGIDACRYDKDFGFRTDNENVICWMPVPPLKGGETAITIKQKRQ